MELNDKICYLFVTCFGIYKVREFTKKKECILPLSGTAGCVRLASFLSPGTVIFQEVASGLAPCISDLLHCSPL